MYFLTLNKLIMKMEAKSAFSQGGRGAARAAFPSVVSQVDPKSVLATAFLEPEP
jgi:hypothetical protein